MSEVAEAGIDQQARDLLITQWKEAKEAFTVAQETERALRAQVVEAFFPNAAKGTNRVPIGWGYSLKYVRNIDYKLGDKDLVVDGNKVSIADQVEHLQATIDSIGNEGQFLSDRLIKWTPELSATEYNKLDVTYPVQAEIKAKIDKMLTTKDASPVLELEAPKGK